MDAPYYNGDDDRRDECMNDPLFCECPECRTWRDNREGSEPDGEAFRGGEAAAYERDQQIERQRLK